MTTAKVTQTEGVEGTPVSIELPEGWVSTHMGAIAKVIGGGTPRPSDSSNFATNHGCPWVTPADLSGYQQVYISTGQRSLSAKGLQSCSATLVPKGTVLMSSRAPIG